MLGFVPQPNLRIYPKEGRVFSLYLLVGEIWVKDTLQIRPLKCVSLDLIGNNNHNLEHCEGNR
jgi:hypothetical protein